MRAVVYLRIGESQFPGKGGPLDKHRQACLEYAGRMGWTIHRVFRDVGRASKSKERPGLAEAIANLESDDLILAADRAKLAHGRSEEFHRVVQAIKAKGASLTVVSVPRPAKVGNWNAAPQAEHRPPGERPIYLRDREANNRRRKRVMDAATRSPYRSIG